MSTNPKIRFPGNCARRLALVLGLAAAFAVFTVGGAEFHVAPAPAGDDSNPGLAAKPFASLEKAVFNYFGGSDITVSNNLFIDCPLTFGNRIRVQILTNALPATISIPCPSGLIHFRFFTTFVVDKMSLQK